ncbi:ATP-grasp domain-containing protein [Baekduia soli]|uniref:ATP-grasp domain-containing protein n=1 Tax=Baekduia soli TaxID=496014 RepID=UPI001E35025D|nr:hypothetical protein [Baekduia soli]
MAAFAPARAMYARAGFTPCPPFGDHGPSPNSTCMTLVLGEGAPAPRIAFATCSALPGGADDDRPAAVALGADVAVWDDAGVDWSSYDLVIVRSAWDYTEDLGAFLAWCRAVGPERLRNAPELIAFNADKSYLAALDAPTVPTALVAPGDPLPALRGEVVVKPSVSAGAVDTGRFSPRAHDDARALIGAITASGRTALVQPYLDAVDVHGETALVFFAGHLSHVLAKRAVLGRDAIAPRTALAPGSPVQVAAAMLEPDLVAGGTAQPDEIALAERVIEEVTQRFGRPPLYARVDLLRGQDGRPVLLELEAVEPCLYLGQAPGAAERFAAAVRRELAPGRR